MFVLIEVQREGKIFRLLNTGEKVTMRLSRHSKCLPLIFCVRLVTQQIKFKEMVGFPFCSVRSPAGDKFTSRAHPTDRYQFLREQTETGVLGTWKTGELFSDGLVRC